MKKILLERQGEPLGRLLRLPEVIARIGVGRTTWLVGVRQGLYPKPVRIGARAVAWRSTDIELVISRGVQ